MATTYPYTQTAMLVNSITSTTVISIASGMQFATITYNCPSGVMGEITLSPVQPTATNVTFQSAQQVLFIELASFKAQFGFDPGQVSNQGTGTDQNGENPEPFNKAICSWS